MNNKKVIIAVILGIGAVISLIYGIAAPAKGGKTAASASAVSPALSGVSSKRHAAKTNFNFWGRNPFSLEKASVEAGAGLVLNGILWDDKRPLAIINNDVIGIGGKIGGNTVIDIKKDSVILNNGAGNFELRSAQ